MFQFLKSCDVLYKSHDTEKVL